MQLRMMQVEVAPLVVGDGTFDRARLPHPFAVVDAAELVQEVFHARAFRNRRVRFDCPGTRRVEEAGPQGHRDKPTPRNQPHQPAEHPNVPGILERETVDRELDPPAEVPTAPVSDQLPDC
jgi:hypothetical protein